MADERTTCGDCRFEDDLLCMKKGIITRPDHESCDSFQKGERSKTDPINPEHYKETSLECFDVLRMVLGADGFANFCIGNIVKYLWRHESKNGYDDVLKAERYKEELLVTLEGDMKADIVFRGITDTLCKLCEKEKAKYED